MSATNRLAGRGGRAGQTTAEFTGIATAFILVMFGVFEMGMAVYCNNTLASATRQAARYAALHGPNRVEAQSSDAKTVVLNNAAGLDPNQLTVTLTWPADSNLPSQNDAKVSSSYNYSLNIPFMSSLTLHLAATSQVLVEQ